MPLSTRRARNAVLLSAILFLAYWVVHAWRAGGPVQRGIDSNGHPWLGAANPKITVHEFTDYACPHCASAAQRMERLVAEHARVLRVVRHEYPRMRCPRIPPYSHCEYARVALCAADQGQFWKMDEWLFEHVAESLRIDVTQAARDVGIAPERLASCVTSPEIFDRADRLSREATEAHVSGTPSYVIEGKVYEGSAVFGELEKRL